MKVEEEEKKVEVRGKGSVTGSATGTIGKAVIHIY